MNPLPITYPSDGMFGRPTWRGLLMLTATLLALMALWCALRFPNAPAREISQQQMFELIKAGHVTYLSNEPDAATGIRYLTGTCSVPSGQTAEIPAHFKVAVDLQLDPYLLSEIKQAGYNGAIETVNNTNIAWPLFLNFVPIILFLVLFALFLRLVYRLVLKS